MKNSVGSVYPGTGNCPEVNEELDAEPELVNNDPYGRGWMVKISLANPGDEAGLLSRGGLREIYRCLILG